MAIAFDDLKDVRPPTGGNLLVVDGLNLSFRWKHMGQFDFAEAFVSTIESLAKSYDCGKIIVLTDYKGSSFRTKVDPEYKANRKEKYKDQTQEEKDDIEAFFKGFEKALELAKEKFPVIQIEGVEADDIAAYITKEATGLYDHIWLISTDRDWDLLVSDEVSRFSYITRKEYTVENWSEHYDIPREQYLDYKVLQGDSGDNVPGIPGVGPKRAISLLEIYGTAMDLYAHIPIAGKAKYIQNVNSSGDRILKNFELMDLVSYCEDAIGYENLHLIDEVI